MEKVGNQFGTVKGVFIPSILTILGVILFLRMGWVVGQAGLVASIGIILLSSLITFLTGLSISATATNTAVGPGGSYFLISRCFGVEPGAAVGIPLYLAQALGISFYSVGFAESLGLFFPSIPINIVAFTTLVVLTGVTLFSSDLALKTQTFIFIAILLALTSFYLGSPITADPTTELKALEKAKFWEIFAIFFPAVTGIEAGISMSGDLKDPKKSLPMGTILAVVVGAIVYVFSAYMFSRFAEPQALITNSLIMTEIAVVPLLIFIGLWGATLSSTMGALLGAPRTLQAMAKDRIVPRVLGKGAPKTNDPRIATGVSFVIAACGILLGDLNTIASVLSMFFLTSYGALNLVSALEGLIDNPSWRPSFRVHWSISMLGAFLCFSVMFMIDAGSSFIAIGAVSLVYYVMKRRRIKSNYSDIRSGLTLHFARKFIYKLNRLTKDARNWRPNFLVLSGSPQSRLHLIQLADSISHKRGFLTAATVLTSESYGPKKLASFERANQDFLYKNKIEALTKAISCSDLKEATLNLLDYYGVGEIAPNTLVLGDTSRPEEVAAHSAILVETFKRGKNVLVVHDSSTSAESLAKGGRQIDIWWGKQSENRGLMLALAYMLNTSKQWKKSRITIKNWVANEAGKTSSEKSIREFVRESRISANVEVYVSEEGLTLHQLTKKSVDADLVFIGMESPEDHQNYPAYYRDLIEATENLKTAILVLEAEGIDFESIFR